MSVLPIIKSYLNYKQVTGEDVAVGDLLSLLATVHVHTVILFVCHVNNSIKNNNVADKKMQSNLAFMFLDEGMRDKVNASPWATDPSIVAIFHQQQQLLLLKLALLVCPHEGEEKDRQAAVYAYGRACLMVSSILEPVSDDKKPQTNLLSFANRLLPVYELASDNAAFALIARTYRLWQEVIEDSSLQKDVARMDLIGCFRVKYGLEFGEYLRIAIALFAYVGEYDPSKEGCERYLSIDN